MDALEATSATDPNPSAQPAWNRRPGVLLLGSWLITVVLCNTSHPFLSAVAMARLIYTGNKELLLAIYTTDWVETGASTL